MGREARHQGPALHLTHEVQKPAKLQYQGTRGVRGDW